MVVAVVEVGVEVHTVVDTAVVAGVVAIVVVTMKVEDLAAAVGQKKVRADIEVAEMVEEVEKGAAG